MVNIPGRISRNNMRLRFFKKLLNYPWKGRVRMAFDFKKEFKEFYLPKGKPEIVTVPEMNYIAV